MRYLLVTDTPLAAAIAAEAALPGERLTILSADRNLARRLRRKGHEVVTGSLERASTWTKLALDADTLVVVALADQQQTLQAVRTVTARLANAPIVVLDPDHAEGQAEPSEIDALRNVERVRLTDVLRQPFQEKFANALVKQRVHEWLDHFHDADRILILLHDEPDPDALAASLALRALLGRNRQTAIIGTFKRPSRPENVRMVELLGLDVREITESDLASFARIAVVDTQPHIFGSKVPHADLVIDHHPPRTGYTASFKDIRPQYGATTSMILDDLIRCGIPISGRLATAAAYAIKTDTWTFRRGSVPVDVALFAQVYPQADQGTLRRIETEGFTLANMRLMGEVARQSEIVGRFIYAHVGVVARDDLVPTAADFLLNVAEAHWTAVSGILGDSLTISVRNLGFQRSAGDLVQQAYGDLGSAGGHRAAAKAILPVEKVRERFGDPDAPDFARRLFQPLRELAGSRTSPVEEVTARE
jgi:nanoRNase/pAp phosphatase (c-di-AMP/oligoRNAs hydrolase)